MNKGKKQSILNKINYLYLFLILVCLFSFISTIPIVYAEDIEYSDVLEDLQKDENFNIDDYIVVGDDYSLDVIQIAESSDDELFVYVYQPCGGLVASSINISKTIGDKLNYENYTLTLIDHEETIFKYKVDNFVLRDELIRYYDISTIYRPFDEELDSSLLEDDGNTISEVAYPVARLWTVSTNNGNVEYASTDTEVVEITDKYVGFLRYSENLGLNSYDTLDNYFVAFSTDIAMERLVSAEIFFQTQEYLLESWPFNVGSQLRIEFSEPEPETVVINADDKVVIDSNILFAH